MCRAERNQADGNGCGFGFGGYSIDTDSSRNRVWRSSERFFVRFRSLCLYSSGRNMHLGLHAKIGEAFRRRVTAAQSDLFSFIALMKKA
jgi:hypothetical protein